MVEQVKFGEIEGETVYKYKLSNKKTGISLEILTYGATIRSVKVPDKHGNVIDVVLGYDTLEEYTSDGGTYFGALVGRYANRIANGRFEINGKSYQVTTNNNGNMLHGGQVGWNQAIWKAEVHDDVISMSHVSEDGDQGFPGTVETTVTFELTDNHEVLIQYKAKSDKPTPINLTTHPYFNLAGEGSGTIYNHNVTIYADKYLPVAPDLIPTGEIAAVDDTIFDLRQSTKLGNVVNDVAGGGYDHNFCIRGSTGTKQAASIHQPTSGIEMQVYTDQAGMQFYTANSLDIAHGKDGHLYGEHSAFCMETQNYPDAPNHANFPDAILYPDSFYEHKVAYKFGLIKD